MTNKRKGRKGRIYKRLLVFNSIVLLLTMPTNALALSTLIADDAAGDLLEFDKDALDEMGEDIYDFEDFEDISEKKFIKQSNEFYDAVRNERNEAKVVDSPKSMDITAINFDEEEKDFSITMAGKVDLDDDESLIGFIWTAETCYVFIIIEDGGIFIRPDHDNYTDLEIDNKDLIFEGINKDFINEEYVKCMIIYSNDDDVYVVETFYNNELNETLIFWFLVIGLIALVVIVIVYYKKKK